MIVGIRKGLLVYVLIFFCCVHTSAQTIEIVGEIEDDFLKVPLSGVKVSILNPDSTVVVDSYNPQIQISVVSGTKRSIFRQKNKTKRSKKRLHTTLIKPEQKVNEDLCSGFIVS